jgi:hypothetical protein
VLQHDDQNLKLSLFHSSEIRIISRVSDQLAPFASFSNSTLLIQSTSTLKLSPLNQWNPNISKSTSRFLRDGAILTKKTPMWLFKILEYFFYPGETGVL